MRFAAYMAHQTIKLWAKYAIPHDGNYYMFGALEESNVVLLLKIIRAEIISYSLELLNQREM